MSITGISKARSRAIYLWLKTDFCETPSSPSALDVAVKFHGLRSGFRRAVSESDNTGAVQDKFFPTQAHLASAERDESSVRALVHEHEFAGAQLDLGVPPRGHSVDNDHRILRRPAEPDGLFHHDFAAAIGNPDRRLAARSGRAETARNQGVLGARLPHDFVNVHLQDFAFDRHRRKPSRHFTGVLSHGLHGFARSHHLSGKRNTGHARGHVHGVAEDVVAFLYHRTVVKADADLELDLAFAETLRDVGLHFAC